MSKTSPGTRVGKLVILGRATSRTLLCKCDCGKTKAVRQSHLSTRAVKSCGCSQNLYDVRFDLSGHVVGRWTVVKRVASKIDPKKVWYACVCSCGTKRSVPYANLTSGKSRSCGCLRIERISLHPGAAEINSSYTAYKAGAKTRSLPFELTRDEFKALVEKPCHYCGHVAEGFNGVDRVDSRNGYNLCNCVTCCTLCNRAKRDYAYSTFVEWIARVKVHTIPPLSAAFSQS